MIGGEEVLDSASVGLNIDVSSGGWDGEEAVGLCVCGAEDRP